MAFEKQGKGDLRGFPLRMHAEERATVERAQQAFREHGLTLSLNDVIRHLIRRAEIGTPQDAADGFRRLRNHTAGCPVCSVNEPPRCADGVYLREQNRSMSRAPSTSP